MKEFHGTFINRPRRRAGGCRHNETGAADEASGWALKRSRLCFMCDATWRERQSLSAAPHYAPRRTRKQEETTAPSYTQEEKHTPDSARRIYNTHS